MSTPTRSPASILGRAQVLRALTNGPRTGGDLADTLAVRVGTKKLVQHAVNSLRKDALICVHARSGPWVTWKLTEAGVVAAGELLAKRAA